MESEEGKDEAEGKEKNSRRLHEHEVKSEGEREDAFKLVGEALTYRIGSRHLNSQLH